MAYNVVLVSGVQQSESVIHIHISILFPHIGYYKLPNRFSCALQEVLVNHLFYAVVCVCYCHPPNFPPPPKGFPFSNHKIGLEICVYVCFFKSVLLYHFY